MPVRAYAVPIRNDLSDSVVQFNDVFPNTSQTTSLSPVGQTGYINPGYFVTNPTAGQPPVYEFPLGIGLPATDTGGGLKRLNNTGYVDGLAVWALDNLCGFDGGANDGLGLSAAQARSWASRVICRAVKGQSLTVTDLCTCLVAVSSVSGGVATSSYTNSLIAGGGGQIGTGPAQKTNAVMVEEVLKILSGQVYRMLDNAVLADDPGNDYTAVAHNPATSDGLTTGTTLSGFLTAPNTNTTAAQTFPASLDFVPFRTYYYGSEILASSQEGQLALFATHQLGAGSFAFEAAKLSDGQTTASYGYSATTSTAGTARALQNTVALNATTGITNANPAIVNTVTAHGLVEDDIIRIRGCTISGSVVSNACWKVGLVTSPTAFRLNTLGSADINNAAAAGNSTGGTLSLENHTQVAGTVSSTDFINIPSSGTTAYEFRAIVVYDNEGNVLTV